MNEKSRWLVPRVDHCLYKTAEQSKCGGRVRGDTDVDDLPPLQGDHDKA
jgi:hypothetical protein